MTIDELIDKIIKYEITLKGGEKKEIEICCITRSGAFNQLQKIENIIKAEEIKVIEF